MTNALATFMFFMNNVLCPYLDKFVIVFIYDILVYSKHEEENAKNLVALLSLLREHQLDATHNKGSFFQTKVHYVTTLVKISCNKS